MKKLLCITLLLFFNSGVYCQEINTLKFAIQLGAAFANSRQDEVNQPYSVTEKTKTGLLAGCFLNYTVRKSLLLQPALLYVRKGAKQHFQNTYANPLVYNYIEIPLNIVYTTKTGNSIFGLGGGLSPAFKLNTILATNETKNFDLGVNALAMYQWAIGFSANVRYTYSLLNTSAVKTNISKIQNSYFSITAGYEF